MRRGGRVPLRRVGTCQVARKGRVGKKRLRCVPRRASSCIRPSGHVRADGRYRVVWEVADGMVRGEGNGVQGRPWGLAAEDLLRAASCGHLHPSQWEQQRLLAKLMTFATCPVFPCR